VVEFEQWMRVHRGVSEQTLLNYRLYIADLLHTIGDDPKQFEAKSLRTFILLRARHGSIAKAKYLVTAVRMFLRYLIAMEQCPPGIDEALPCIAQWRLSTLPRYLQAEDVDHVLSVCDPSTPQGTRDKAILLLLSRLGLRAGDIARLSLADIDWRSATLRVTGKSRRESYLPLPQEVGEALLHYLKHGRPPHADPHIFLSVVAPWAPLSRCGVSSVAAQALRRSGVDTPSFGAHVFRHTVATALLRQGVPLQTIGDILRHASIETTTHYAKVDVNLLRQLTRPWPEETSC
jgi:integrase/recombinase XerD